MAASRAGRAVAWAVQRRALARWGRRAARADSAPLSELRRQAAEAQALRAALERLLLEAGTRLALPRIGAEAAVLPAGTDWHWRPPFWRGPFPGTGLAAVESQTRLGDGLAVFHDCRDSALTLRQLRNRSEDDLAPFALRLDVLDFDGSFLSLALDLPPESCAGLQKRHLVRLELALETERPLEIFARLNIRHGPNVEQQVHELPARSGRVAVEFDLAYTRLNEKRVEAAWLDLIFDRPAMNQIVLSDLVLARYPRAEV